MKIEVRDLSFSYSDNKILDKVSFSINSGENVVLIGSNGSGKSTLLKSLLGLKNTPENTILYGDKDITDNNNYLLDIGFVFQNPEDQFVHSIVEDELAFRMENIGMPRLKISTKIDEVLKTLNISELKNKKVNELSGGQMQKIALASQLALDNKILVLDEPTSMLDIKSAHDFNESLKLFKGMTLLRVTHKADEILTADRVLVLHNGKIISDTTPLKFFKDDKLMKICRIDKPISIIAKEKK